MTASNPTVGERDEPDATELIRRARSGDLASFEALYRAHVGRVYAICVRLSGNAGRAEELTQDVFVRMWERLSSFRGESAFSTWLYRLTVNCVLQQDRGDRRREARVFPFRDLRPVDRGIARSPELAIDLERAIAGLPPKARRVLVLYDIEGYRHEEIAALLGIAEGTVRAQLCRARRLLMEALER